MSGDMNTILNATTANLLSAANASAAGVLPATLGALVASNAIPVVKLQN
jgi:hypothetical protein